MSSLPQTGTVSPGPLRGVRIVRDGTAHRDTVRDETAGRYGGAGHPPGVYAPTGELSQRLRLSERDTRRVLEPGANFYEQNRNKLGITLDLGRPEGLDILRRLIAVSDVFAENFTPRVIRNFGLEYGDLCRIRPDIIMVSSTGYGFEGPGPTSAPPDRPPRGPRGWPMPRATREARRLWPRYLMLTIQPGSTLFSR